MSLTEKIVVFIILALFSSWPYFEKIKVYGWARRIVFGIAILALLAFGIIDIVSTEKQSTKKDLKIDTLQKSVTSIAGKIDSLGYKIDKPTGKLVPKIIYHKPLKIKAPKIKGDDLGYVDEIPKGKIDGVNKVYTVSHLPIEGTFQFFYNGVKQSAPDDFTIKDTVMTLKFSPSNTGNNDHINVTYRYLKN